MKALGTGLGGFALTDVEVRRSVAVGPTRNAPYGRPPRGSGHAGRRTRGRTVPSLLDAHDRGGHRVRRGRTARSVLPVLTRDEMRAADAAALSSVSRGDPGGAGRYGRRPRCPAYPAGRLRPPRDGDRRQGQQRCRWPRGRCVPCPAWGPGHGDRRRRTSRRGFARWTSSSTAPTAPAFAAPMTRRVVPPGIPVLSIDIPSGVDADTGAAPGRRIRGQPHGHLRRLQARAPPRVPVPPTAAWSRWWTSASPWPPPRAAMIEDVDVAASLPPRPRQSNKWSTALGVASGSIGMEGSAILCTRGALAAGAGMIRLGTPGNPAGELADRGRPGQSGRSPLGRPVPRGHREVQGDGHRARTRHRRSGTGADPCRHRRARRFPLVVDADAITALGDLAARAHAPGAARAHPTILTPHDGEYARLAGSPPGDDRLAAARDLAPRWGPSSFSRARSPRWPPLGDRMSRNDARRVARRGRGPGAGHGRNGRRALGPHRWLPGPRRAGASGRCAGRPRPRQSRRAGTARGPGGGRPARHWRGSFSVRSWQWLTAP